MFFGFLAGGSKENAVPGSEFVVAQELSKMVAAPMELAIRSRNGLFMVV